MKLKWQDDTIKSPLGRARGLGSSGHGVDHWIQHRVTAISNFILMTWLIWSVVHHLSGSSYEEFTLWLSQPVNSILMIFSIISVFYHAHLGTQVIVEDYVHNEGFKFAKLIGMKLFFVGAAVACIFAVIKIALQA